MRAGALAVLTSAWVLGVMAPAWAQTAPGAPGATARWTTGAKQGVGTSTTTASKVWFSLAEGVLTEVYYPRVDVADSRALELVVSDGRTFTDRESTDTTHAVELVTDTALVYRQINTDKQRRYRITKTYVTDPLRATVLVDVDFESLDRGRYAVYAVYDPAIDNSGRHDAGSVSRGALVAREGEIASALVADEPFRAVSNGYLGTSDGYTDLADHVMDWRYADAPDGNVVQTARLALDGRKDRRLTLALGFGTSGGAAVDTARASLRLPFFLTKLGYAWGWDRYLDSLRKPPKSVGRGDLLQQYRVAAMQLKAHEDKTYRGANIASLTVPWGQAINADEAGVGGYHLVWARDLYQVSTAQLALGDRDAAERSLDYLFDVQQKPDGSFPQNSLLDGTPYWGSLQLDEVAFPIVLAWQLGRRDAATYRDHVKPAADFLVARGPSTPQERWEEEGGYSPSTIAAEIAGLTAAASLARSAGDANGAALYQGVADEWQRRVEGWTFTTTGPHGDGRYFERIDANGHPDDGQPLEINNGGGTWDERAIVDAGFLDLVRLGVKRFNDPFVLASLPEVDSVIRIGDLFYRYNHDGYGEKADGAPYDGTGVGRLWPLLSGERGEYELAAGRSATRYLRALAESANEGWMIPEQVWDRPDAYGFAFGEGTGSATPLAWAMAAYVRLAHSIDAGRPVAMPSVVAERYTRGTLPPAPALTVSSPADGSTTGAATATVAGTTTAPWVYVHAGGATTRIAGGAFSTTVPLGLGVNQITVVAVGADGGTATVQRSVTSTNFGAALGTASDPAGDDNGPGDYVYPANDAFNAGAYDLTGFGVYDDGRSYNFVTTIAGEVRNPWGGNQIAVQRINVYGRTGAATGVVPALPGTNANLEAPYDWVLTADGFNDLGVRDASGATLASATLLALPATRQIVASVPKTAFPGGLGGARYVVAMLSHGGDGEGTGHIRPVYDRAYWDSTAGTGMSWIHDYRLGGGAGVWTEANEARDTDTRDPNTVDVLVPAGTTQAAVLDWRAAAPVTLRYVTLG
jgi:glucan 1,4-alpha-glucosidase